MIDEQSATQGEAPTAESDSSLRVFLAVVALVLVVGSRLVWSSPEYRQQHLLLAGVLALFAFRSVCWPVLKRSGWRGVVFGAGLLVAHGASWLGGVWHGVTPLAATLAAGQGLIGVAGLAVLVTVLLEPRFHRYAKWTAYGVLGLLVAGSFAGYLIRIERFIELGGYGNFYSQVRMALIWPTRMLTAPFGQIAWDNANYAAYYFALAFGLILESLAAGVGRRRWVRWAWCVTLCASVFLTDSRSGGMMTGIALALILPGRRPKFALKTLVAMAAGLVLGYGVSQVKMGMISQQPKTPGRPMATTEQHGVTYVKRASSGRTGIYRNLWKSLADSRWCGAGLAATGKDVDYLNHEHSSYVATFRGGGLLALAGHALVLAAAGWSAMRLWWRGGPRWPVVLLAVAAGGLLFDRSSVIALTGNYEFLSHWVAALVPLLWASGENH